MVSEVVKRAAVYARVSTAGQLDGTSLGTQIEACTRYAASQGFTVAYTVQEDASGAKLHRKGLDEIRDLAQSGSIEVVVVHDPDRLTRDLGHLMLLVDEFERARVELIFVNAPRENTPEGMMLLQMRGMFAQYERLKIEERTRRGKERKIREGNIYMSGSCAYGYTYLVGQGKLEVLEHEAHWVRRMFQWAAEGVSLRAIATRLHEHGVLTKKGGLHWYPTTLAKVLKNELYAGVWHYGKRRSVEPRRAVTGARAIPKETRDRRPKEEWLSVPAPAIVPRALFDRVQPQLERNKLMSPRNSQHPYLLKGLIVCSRCGYRMFGHYKVNGRWQRLNYECAGRHRMYPQKMEVQCDQPNLTAADVEALVWGEVVRQICDTNILRKSLANRHKTLAAERLKDEAELQVLATVERGIEADKNKFLDLYQSDIIDRETLHERMQALRHRQEAVNASQALLRARMAQENHADDWRLAFVQSLSLAQIKALPLLGFEEKRAFLLALDVRVDMDGHEVTISGLIEKVTLTLPTRYKPRPNRRKNAA